MTTNKSEFDRERAQVPSSAATEPAAAPLTEQLADYLAGQLPPAAARAVEAQLAADSGARRELQLLDQAWQALDELPRAAATVQFVGRTLEMAALQVDPASRPWWRRATGGWAAAGIAWLLLVGVGFGAIRLWDNGNRQLLEDLPLLENLDAYRQVDRVEFLRALADAGLFLEDDHEPR